MGKLTYEETQYLAQSHLGIKWWSSGLLVVYCALWFNSVQPTLDCLWIAHRYAPADPSSMSDYYSDRLITKKEHAVQVQVSNF